MNDERGARLYGQALGLARQAQWQLAEAACQQALRHSPGRADTWALLGEIALRTGRTGSAVEPLRQAIALNDRQPMTHALLGDVLLGLRREQEALASYERALRLDPRLLPALIGRAHALLDLNQLEAARRAYEAVLEQDPNQGDAWFGQASASLALGDAVAAVASLERTLRLRPGYAAAHMNLGVALFSLQRLQPALASFEAAVTAAPGLAQAHRYRGVVLKALKRPAEALRAFERAMVLDPGDLVAARARSRILWALGRESEALQGLATVFARAPSDPEALRLQGDILSALHRYEAAVPTYARLLAVEPDAEFVAGALYHAQLWCAQWEAVTPGVDAASLCRAVLAGRRVDHPFSFLAVSDDPAAQQHCARTMVEASTASIVRLPAPVAYRHERIRVAYVSGDFRQHAVSYLLAGVFEEHDRSRFETIGVSLRAPEPTPIGERMRGAFERFIDVSALSDGEAAKLLRSLEVDVAVDLAGHTSARLGIFAHRPAPVQVQYLGYPGTLGAPFIDYVLADSFVIPAAEAPFYDEKIAYLPDCFQANGDLRRDVTTGCTRAQLGLPAQAFVFCCFNNIYKLNRTMFDVFMRLLARVPGSVLWLYAPSPEARTNLCREAGQRGVDPGRLVFAERVPYVEHIARLRCADLYLDTLPFNGGATASDALWAGVPLLTCTGRAFAARMAGSLLHTLKLPELITGNLNEYEEQAVALARDRALLAALQARLVAASAQSPLFKPGRFCRAMEAAFKAMLGRFEQGLAPASFTVAPES